MENRRNHSKLTSIPSVALFFVPIFLLFLVPNVKSLGLAVEWARGGPPVVGRNEVGGWPIAAGLNPVSVERSFTEQGLYSLRLQLPAMPLLQFLLPPNRAGVYYSLMQGINVVVGVTLAVWLA
ncbi:hypothetical protein [Stieleria mannarensis]|uniref:hypothetical protein n=1 Tax=Stieleria mannarensis TaxID=2755585 RepID=UPI0016041A86|nr:hypothetical protein [Rhodopirellula sp. JC639]